MGNDKVGQISMSHANLYQLQLKKCFGLYSLITVVFNVINLLYPI